VAKPTCIATRMVPRWTRKTSRVECRSWHPPAAALLPLCAQNMLIPSVVARPLQGEPPTIDLVMGYSKSNTSPLLKRFVARADELVAGVQKQNSFKSTSITAGCP
jgi:hypothetical protein